MTTWPSGRKDTGTRIRLFASSYAPLFALLALRFDGRFLKLSLGVLAGVFLVDTAKIVIIVPRRVGANPQIVKTIEDEGGQVAGYLAAYLLPFLAAPSPSPSDLTAYGIFIGITGLVSIRSNLTYINPTLYLFGYRLVSVTTNEGFDGFAVVKSPIREKSVLRSVSLGKNILVEVKK